jgi:hypothetical protein
MNMVCDWQVSPTLHHGMALRFLLTILVALLSEVVEARTFTPVNYTPPELTGC